MISKIAIVVVLVVLAFIAGAAYYLLTVPSITRSSQASTGISISQTVSEQVQSASTDASSVITEGYSNLLQEGLDNVSINQTGFASQTQDGMASDFSQFYFS